MPTPSADDVPVYGRQPVGHDDAGQQESNEAGSDQRGCLAFAHRFIFLCTTPQAAG
jgi:hypothetical protein